jgi:hypothetical protein
MNANIVYYKLDQTWVTLISTDPIITLFPGQRGYFIPAATRSVLFAWLKSYSWKYCSLICWERKTLFIGWKSRIDCNWPCAARGGQEAQTTCGWRTCRRPPTRHRRHERERKTWRPIFLFIFIFFWNNVKTELGRGGRTWLILPEWKDIIYIDI